MADKMKIGPKIVLEGEKEYKQSISEVNKTLSVLASESKKTSAAYSDNANSLKALTEKSDNYKKQVEAQREKVRILTEAYENSKKQLGENSEKTKDWQIKLNNAEAALTKTEKALEDTNKKIKLQSTAIEQVKDKCKEWKDKLEDLKEKHPALTKAIEKTSDAAGKFAKGSLTALKSAGAGAAAGVAAVSAATVAASKALFDAAQQASEAGDKIDKASQRMKISAESYQELSYVAQMSGVNMSALETAASKLSKTAPNMKLDKAIDELASMKDESARTQKAVELFGSKVAYQLTPMLNAGGEGIKELKEKSHELGLVMSDEAVAASAKFGDTLDSMKGTLSAVKNNISAEFLPGITEVMEGITGIFTGDESAPDKIISGIENIIETAEKMEPVVTGIFNILGDTIVQIAPQILTDFVTAILDNLDSVLGAAFSIIETLTEGLLTEENITKLVSAALGLVTKLVEFLGDNSGLIINSAFTMIDALIDGLLEDDNTKKLVQGALDIVAALTVGLIENAPELISGAFELIGTLVDTIIHYDWAAVARRIFDGIKDGIKRLVTGDDGGNGHAGGLDYVPYDGYQAVLHRGEKLLTASEAVAYDRNKGGNSAEIEQLSRKVDRLAQAQSVNNINIVANGTAAGVVRALKLDIQNENERSSVFHDKGE